MERLGDRRQAADDLGARIARASAAKLEEQQRREREAAPAREFASTILSAVVDAVEPTRPLAPPSAAPARSGESSTLSGLWEPSEDPVADPPKSAATGEIDGVGQELLGIWEPSSADEPDESVLANGRSDEGEGAGSGLSEHGIGRDLASIWEPVPEGALEDSVLAAAAAEPDGPHDPEPSLFALWAPCAGGSSGELGADPAALPDELRRMWPTADTPHHTEQGGPVGGSARDIGDEPAARASVRSGAKQD